MKRVLILVGILALSACGKKPWAGQPSTGEAPVSASAAAVNNSAPSSVAVAAPATAPAAPASPTEVGIDHAVPVEVESPLQVDLNPKTVENQAVKEEVLKRIDLMPGLSPESKDKLYVQVERARSMGKIITIPFPSGGAALDVTSSDAIGAKLQLQQIRELTDDPTVVFVVLGFADRKGDPKQNQEISLSRANAVLDVLQKRYQIMNVMHAVGMGSSEMFDAKNLDKNRVVEVWAVLP